jgi:hypothetical protein
MAINIKKASEALKTGHTHAKILIWGNSGSGKSWLSATAPKPLVILTEANGAVSIGHSNKDADIVVIDNADDLRQIAIMAKSGKLSQYKTLVFDSLTECQKLFKDEIVGNRDTLKIQEWGLLANRMLKFIRLIRDLPFHIVCTALADKNTDDQGGILNNLPQFEGKKTANEIMQYFSAVGYLFGANDLIDEKQILVRKLMFEPTNKWFVKPCHPLTNMQDPDMTQIINSIVSGKLKK